MSEVLETLNEMMQTNLEFAQKVREGGNEVPAILTIQRHDKEKIDMVNINDLMDNKPKVGQLLKNIGADKETYAIVLMCEVWVTEINTETGEKKEKTESLHIIGESETGEKYVLSVPIEGGELQEPTWTDLTGESVMSGTFTDFFALRDTSRDKVNDLSKHFHAQLLKLSYEIATDKKAWYQDSKGEWCLKDGGD